MKHNIEMKLSRMIGDKDVDIEAANASGIKNTILVKSGHEIDESNSEIEHSSASENTQISSLYN